MTRPLLSDLMRQLMRRRGYSERTIEAYIAWGRRFVRFHGRDARELGPVEITAFLNHLASERRVSASTQNQALNALVFLYREVLGVEPGVLEGLERARGRRHMPAVLTHGEVLRILEELGPPFRLMAMLMYGSGLRLREVLELRVKDIDLEGGGIEVRDGKGKRDRLALLPRTAVPALVEQIEQVAQLHRREVAAGRGRADLPDAFAVKSPRAAWSLAWQHLFPASRPRLDPIQKAPVRGARHPTSVQRAFSAAVDAAGVRRRATCHCLRHSFATEFLRHGGDVRTLQRLMGHRNLKTTSVYLHVLRRRSLASPLDGPE